MKKSTMLVGGGMFLFAWWAMQTQGDQTWLEELHRDVGYGVLCEKTKNLNGHTWMACRFDPERDHGSVWLLHEDPDGEIWLARNGPASQTVDRFEQLPPDKQTKSIRIRRSTLEDNMEHGYIHLGVPWDQLN
jgi:hypothetical protein